MSDSSHPETETYPCPICQRPFDRRDHMRRHLGSHQNARAYKCSLCQKAYNRRDVLSRHYAIHHSEPKGTEGQKRLTKKTRTRANKACEACAASKLRCDNGRPCTRCKQAGRACEEQHGETNSPIPDIVSAYDSQVRSSQGLNAANTTNRDIQCPTTYDLEEAQLTLPQGMNHVGTLSEWQVPGQQDWGYPAYFEQIMMPPDPTFVYPDLPVDISTYLQGIDADESWDSLDMLDFVIDSDKSEKNEPQTRDHGETGPLFTPGQACTTPGDKERHPWAWVPTSHQRAFTDQSQILIDRDVVDQAASSPEAIHFKMPIKDCMSQEVRDNLLQFISRVTKSEASISAFPDPEFLDVLVNTGMSRRLDKGSWIHPGTLCYRSMRLELITALIAAGCVCYGISSINKAGVMLQEVVRISLERLFETDNEVIRDIQYLQAFMVWVDIGMTCGYPRKMEIAESRFPQLCTALRSAGVFAARFYKPILPSPEDDKDALSQKWSQWARQESFKRLAYSALELDMRAAITFNRNPATSYVEFTAPLPAASEEWLASSAEEWRYIYLSREYSDDKDQIALRDILPSPSLLNNLGFGLDISKARSVFFSALAGQIFEFQKQVILAKNSCGHRSTSLQLSIRAQQQDLIQALMSIRDTSADGKPELFLLKEFLALSLYTNIEEVQIFAGKHGVFEARRAYSALESWFEDSQSRNAVWHAGQVLRAGQYIQPFQFRGYESIMVYHASLVLWVYGILHGATIKHRIATSPEYCRNDANYHVQQYQSLPDAASQRPIRLDGPLDDTVQQWLDAGSGCPGLEFRPHGTDHYPPEGITIFCDLRNSNLVMAAGRAILENNYQSSLERSRPLPPLVQRLCNMMNELGTLPKTQI